ncbi:MAG: hypothetical protein IKT39_04855 [Clostridia bacterium]|nr:hypothetical protein [Clostridia bacterium]
MFKDIYKAANDDIKPDPYLLGRILNKSKEKPKSFFYRHRIAVFAAALALIIALPSFIKAPENTGSTVLDNNILPEAQNDKTYFILSNKTSENAEESVTENSAADILNTEESAPKNSTTEILTAKTTQDENAPVYTADETTVVMSVNSFSATPQMASLARASGGEMEQIDEISEITAGQYFVDLGFSPDILDVPEGLLPDFTNDTTVTITKQDGETLSDENTFTYSGENFLILTTSSDTENALSYINDEQYEKSIFGDKNAVVLYDGSIYEAHIIHGSGTALKFVTDISEEQLKNLLISAAE